MSALAFTDWCWDDHDILVPVGSTTSVLRQESTPMDPDEALAEMRAALAASKRLHDEADRLMEEANDTGSENDEFVVRQLAFDQDRVAASRAAALDEWLSRGAFPPAAWRR